MSKKDKVINNPDENADAKKIQKWSVWTQGPKDAKETQRKFKLTTPGQERDYKKLVSKRRLKKKRLQLIVWPVVVLTWHLMLVHLVRLPKSL